MTLRTVAENLNIGAIASQFCFQLLMEFGYFSYHFIVTHSSDSDTFASVDS